MGGKYAKATVNKHTSPLTSRTSAPLGFRVSVSKCRGPSTSSNQDSWGIKFPENIEEYIPSSLSLCKYVTVFL